MQKNSLTYIFLIFVMLNCMSCTNKNNDVVESAYSLETSNEYFKPGQQAPDFELELMKDGVSSKSKLSSFFGKPILLNFWASWCVPCVAEMPELAKFAEDMKDEVELILINTDPMTSRKDAELIIEKNKIKAPVFFDPELLTVEKFFVSGFPETFLISKSGKFLELNDVTDNKRSIRIISERKWGSLDIEKSIREAVSK